MKTSQLAVVVPTLDRPELLVDLVANIHEATTAIHRVYLVMESSDKDSIRVSESLDTTDVIGRYGSCSRAINAGYWASSEPFVAVVNDDVLFHRGWDQAALACFSDQVHAVGVNDGHGDCKCFPMVRRAFIEEHSGVFDRPNTLFHEYQSQGPDTEFAFYAMLRGVWADAPDAIVEHRNWRYGGADPNHPNYLKARATVEEDLAEYQRRWPQWDPGLVMPPPSPTVTPI